MKKDSPQFEKMLKKAFTSSPNAEFKKSLQQSLLEKAPNYLQQEVKSSNWWNYLLNFISMHKYSSITALSLLIIFGLVLTFTPFQENTVNAEILKKISNTYEEESTKTGIFYQKWLVESAGWGKNEKKFKEIWYDNNQNHLQVVKDFDTQRIISAEMEKQDNHFTLSKNDYSQDPLFGPQYYCVNIIEKDNVPYEAVLQVSKSNPNYVHISASKELSTLLPPEHSSKTSEELFQEDLFSLLDTRSNSQTIQKILKKLKQALELNNGKIPSHIQNITFKEVIENNKKYYLLKVIVDNYGSNISMYFNSENYRLEKQKFHTLFQTETLTLLKQAYLGDTPTHQIFDPEKYKLNKVRSLGLGLNTEAKSLIQEKNNGTIVDGCYDGETGIRLDPEQEKKVLESVELVTWKAFENMKDDIKKRLKARNK